MAEPLRALVIGCGKIAGGYSHNLGDTTILTHAAAYRHHAGYRLSACVDPDETARRVFASTWNVPSAYATLDDALAAQTFDVASVCTPTGTHVAILRRLLETNVRAIIVEKPVDGNIDGMRTLAAVARSRRVPVAVNFTRRFDPTMRVLRQDIAEKKLGILRSAVGYFGRGTLNNASHLLDLCVFLTGCVPKLISIGPQVNDLSKEDPSISAIFDLGGVPFHIVAADARDCLRFELELAFDRAIVAIENLGFMIRHRSVLASSQSLGGQMADTGRHCATRLGEAFLVLFDEVASALESGAPIASDLDTAATSIALAQAVLARARDKEIAQ